jgi:hypothetical protein
MPKQKLAVPKAPDLVNGHEPHILDAAQLADSHRSSGVIDARYFEAFLLQVQREPSRATADIEDPAFREVDRLPLAAGPASAIGKVARRPSRRRDKTIDSLPRSQIGSGRTS